LGKIIGTKIIKNNLIFTHINIWALKIDSFAYILPISKSTAYQIDLISKVLNHQYG